MSKLDPNEYLNGIFMWWFELTSEEGDQRDKGCESA